MFHGAGIRFMVLSAYMAVRCLDLDRGRRSPRRERRTSPLTGHERRCERAERHPER
jgi:hypothetical protein